MPLIIKLHPPIPPTKGFQKFGTTLKYFALALLSSPLTLTGTLPNTL